MPKCTHGGGIWQNWAHGQRTRRGRCLRSGEDYWYASGRGTIKVSSMLPSNTASLTNMAGSDFSPLSRRLTHLQRSSYIFCKPWFISFQCFAFCILFKLSVQLLLGHIVHLVSPSSIQLLCVRSPLSCWGQGRIFFFRLFYLYCWHRTLHSRHNVHQTQYTVYSFVYIFKSIPKNSQWWFTNVTVMIDFHFLKDMT